MDFGYLPMCPKGDNRFSRTHQVVLIGRVPDLQPVSVWDSESLDNVSFRWLEKFGRLSVFVCLSVDFMYDW